MLLYLLGIVLMGVSAAQQQQTQTNSVIRTTNSVDIQLCVQTAFLTPQRDAFLQALTTHLTQDILNSNALYLDRLYTTVDGGLCYLFVYQAPSPENAVNVLERLAEQTAVYVPLGATTIQCSVDAAQWSGDNLAYLGAPFPGMWTVNDLLLWGACFLTVLSLCLSGLCCYAFILLRRAQNPAPSSSSSSSTASASTAASSKGSDTHSMGHHLKLSASSASHLMKQGLNATATAGGKSTAKKGTD